MKSMKNDLRFGRDCSCQMSSRWREANGNEKGNTLQAVAISEKSPNLNAIAWLISRRAPGISSFRVHLSIERLNSSLRHFRLTAMSRQRHPSMEVFLQQSAMP